MELRHLRYFAMVANERSFRRAAEKTHRFAWNATSVFFQSLRGHYDDNSNEFAQWLCEPPDPASQLGQQPVPVEINLWLFKGQPPQDGQEVELIVRSFKFTPMQ